MTTYYQSILSLEIIEIFNSNSSIFSIINYIKNSQSINLIENSEIYANKQAKFKEIKDLNFFIILLKSKYNSSKRFTFCAKE